MKIRAKKSKRNSEYTFDDFLLKEFSQDKEVFIPNLELSCNHCETIENSHTTTDSPLTFLIKFKADNLSDPKAIKGGVTGFLLQDDLQYEHCVVESNFESVSKNHFNLKLNEKELVQLAENIFYHPNDHQNYNIDSTKDYLIKSYTQKDWKNLFNQKNKKKWKKYLGKILKEKLVEDYGEIDEQNVKDAIRLDETDYKSRIQEISNYSTFEKKELKYIQNFL